MNSSQVCSSAYTPADIERVTLVLGMEVHVELSTRSKVFSHAANPAARNSSGERASPNTLIDPVVLALPGSLPILNRAAVEMSMMVGQALGCTLAERTKWDRKSYFYPDLPKAYQISQYDMPLCFDGAIDIPNCDERGEPDPLKGFTRIGIIRAHLEEDAGKLLHELPSADARGGTRIDHSIVDLNRAGAPLLEIVTQPDFTSADQAVAFARLLRMTCRFLGVTEGIMQNGHMRFEPNINCIIYLKNGRTATTPITEVKNLNSFRSLKGAIEHELREQPRRWLEDGVEFGPGTKSTRGWNDARNETFLQRSKEDAHDYRYFPDPDLPVLTIDEPWRERVRASIPELPISRLWRCRERFGLDAREALALVEERSVAEFYDAAVTHASDAGVPGDRAGRLVANLLLQNGAKRVNERASERGGNRAETSPDDTESSNLTIADLGISAAAVGALAALRERGAISANALDELFGLLCEPTHAGADPETLALERNLIIVRDDAAMEKWCAQVLADNAPIVDQIKGGKLQAIGRLVGNVMKLSGGTADAAQVRAKLLDMIGVKE
ncbi:MAG: Asp-tRNA(Asn)/Glu-tRNA(Gln) amidotransferase subunit GatB [Phycisphaeraceae bacterium]|nr:Asp-tRNA(Asn)/Glu-tRNA(Gln) amidotransferase subunit GatB [Phycisphaeraceae bacterium]